MNDKLKPAIIGGVVLGLLSVIPFVNFANACCCLWAIIGGMLATYLYVKNSPMPVTAGDGAMLGVIAGVVGAVISIILGIPIDLIMGPVMRNMMVGLIERLDPRQADILRQQFDAAGPSIGSAIFGALISAVLLCVFSIIGGLLGVPIFERRKGGAPPPPPPINVGGGTSGYAT
jgi:MFS superfamily sulfate permease-like transporter